MGKRHEFVIPGRYECISDACDFVAAGAEEAGLGTEEVFRIQLACDEACTNVIEHAYGAEDQGDIRLIWEYDSEAFTITILDNGHPFDPAEITEPLVPADPDDVANLKIGGLGVHFMRSLMDEVRFTFNPDEGNKLVMTKLLAGQNEK